MKIDKFKNILTNQNFIKSLLAVGLFASLVAYSYIPKKSIKPSSEISQSSSVTVSDQIENTSVKEESLASEIVAKEDESAEIAENSNADENQNQQVQTEEPTVEEEKNEQPQAPRAGLTIGVVADAHAGQDNGWQKLSAFAWTMSNVVYPDVIFDLGDLVENRKNFKNISKKDAETDYRKARAIISRFPVYNVIGNHELLSMSKNNVMAITGRKNYYAVDVKGYNVIVLDANYTAKEKTIDATNDDKFIYTGTITDKEKSWLKDQLKSHEKNIILVHHPLYILTNADEVEDVIRDNKKKIVLIASGHKHPDALRVKNFGGVKEYEIPSLEYSKRQYVIIKINGMTASVVAKRT